MPENAIERAICWNKRCRAAARLRLNLWPRTCCGAGVNVTASLSILMERPPNVIRALTPSFRLRSMICVARSSAVQSRHAPVARNKSRASRRCTISRGRARISVASKRVPELSRAMTAESHHAMRTSSMPARLAPRVGQVLAASRRQVLGIPASWLAYAVWCGRNSGFCSTDRERNRVSPVGKSPPARTW